MPVSPILMQEDGEVYIWFGEDDGVGPKELTAVPAPWPNADAARADFLSHIANPSEEDFEGYAHNTPTPTVVFPNGVTAIFANNWLGCSVIEVAGPTDGGGRWPTSGVKLLRISPPEVGQVEYTKVSFAPAIRAFGGYSTDLGDYTGPLGEASLLTLELTFADLTTQTVTYPNMSGPGSGQLPTSGSVSYFGLITDSKLITEISIRTSTSTVDVWGFDDFVCSIGVIGVPAAVCVPGFYSVRCPQSCAAVIAADVLSATGVKVNDPVVPALFATCGHTFINQAAMTGSQC